MSSYRPEERLLPRRWGDKQKMFLLLRENEEQMIVNTMRFIHERGKVKLGDLYECGSDLIIVKSLLLLLMRDFIYIHQKPGRPDRIVQLSRSGSKFFEEEILPKLDMESYTENLVPPTERGYEGLISALSTIPTNHGN